MTRSRLVSSFLCAFVLVGASSTAHAAALDAARKAYADLTYEACRDEAKRALLEPSSKEERVEGYRLLGLCQAALEDSEAALDAFVKMLAIDPAAQLPAGLSPRFTSSYLEAKGHWVGTTPLALVVEEDRTEGRKRVVRVAVNDEAGLVDKVTWEDDEGERAPPLKAAERMELEVPADSEVRLLGLDARGGVVTDHLLSGPAQAAVAAADPPSQGAAGAGEEDPGNGMWLWVGVAAGAGLVVAGGAAAVAGAMLSPPSRVNLESQVVFGNP